MLRLGQHPIVFTDLDGTLLDHNDYRTDAVEPVLTTLIQAGIPVIPTTSKTFSELQSLMPKLRLNTPFIVENGAALFIPKEMRLNPPQGCDSIEGYWRKSFTQHRRHWQPYIEQAKHEFEGCFRLMTEMSAVEVAKLTGLTEEESKQALQRDYGEPVKWLGNAEQEQQFIAYMQQQGATVLKGGRFLHIGGCAQKGIAMAWLMDMYQQIDRSKDWFSIALGDSHNDISMLEAADVAIRIRSQHHDFPILNREQGVLDSHQYGPQGWAECMKKILLLDE